MADGAPPGAAEDALVLDLDGFEGPIDLLLALARAQKVDLARISVLQLADQYLDYVRRARGRNLELAADYLVTAAWLAYLKSRLLVAAGDEEEDEEPSAEELAEALAWRLRRLDAMRGAAQRLMARDLLGREVFARGADPEAAILARPASAATLGDLIAAYAETARRNARRRAFRAEPLRLPGAAAAARRLAALLGAVSGWTALARFLPRRSGGPLEARAELAATFAAALELAREGRIELRQAAPFAPIFLRPAPPRRGEA